MKTEEILRLIKDFQKGILSLKDTNLLFSYLIQYVLNGSKKYGLQEADRDDLSQNVTVQIFSFLKEHPFADIYTLGFVNVAIKNAFINTYRKKKKDGIVGEEHFPIKASPYNLFEEQDSFEYLKRVLEQCMHEELFDAFILCTQGYKYGEISKKINVPVGTVRSRIHLARQISKKRLSR